MTADADLASFHASMPGFRPTPLIAAPDLAAMLDVGEVYVKHERERLGLPSFKVLGASWAINCVIAGRCGRPVPRGFAGTRDLSAALPAGTTLATATEGNHGRAVAHVARLLGLPCRIYVHDRVAHTRVSAIESEGASIVVVRGSYDDAVRASASDTAANPGHLLVSDTSWPGYEDAPRAIGDGYATIFREAYEQLEAQNGRPYDAAIVPAGVGALASAAVANLLERGCATVTAEPVNADCVRQSLERGAPVAVPGPHGSLLTGLNCGEVSRVAWPTLRSGVRAAVAVSDSEAVDVVRMLAALGIVSGASGAAALAGAIVLAEDPAGAALIRSERWRTLLLVDTEGVTDAESHAAIVAAAP